MKTLIEKLNEALEPDPLSKHIQALTGFKMPKGDSLLDPEDYEREIWPDKDEPYKAEMKHQ